MLRSYPIRNFPSLPLPRQGGRIVRILGRSASRRGAGRLALLALLLLISGCQSTQLLPIADYPNTDHLPDSITLVSWNAQKGGHARFRADVTRLLTRYDPDILLMQEATDDLLERRGIGGHFAGSWSYPFPRGTTIGLMTLSKVAPQQLTRLPSRHREFFVTAPKLSLATEYPLSDGRSLLLVNVHILAFESLRTKAVGAQLADLQATMAAHDGPIIVAGDLNTWSNWRLAMLERMADQLGLEEVVGFPEGRRAGGTGARWADKWLGVAEQQPLDRVYHRGFRVHSADVLPYDSSDHPAVLVNLVLQGAG